MDNQVYVVNAKVLQSDKYADLLDLNKESQSGSQP